MEYLLCSEDPESINPAYYCVRDYPLYCGANSSRIAGYDSFSDCISDNLDLGINYKTGEFNGLYVSGTENLILDSEEIVSEDYYTCMFNENKFMYWNGLKYTGIDYKFCINTADACPGEPYVINILSCHSHLKINKFSKFSNSSSRLLPNHLRTIRKCQSPIQVITRAVSTMVSILPTLSTISLTRACESACQRFQIFF